jgi:2-polyprenyl-6-methoxyphenol hydroxylase-like FAD-dependent oxidoreductase
VDRVAVVGAGPIGLTAALELARREVPTVVLEAKSTLEPTGSRAIVLARHALATFGRLGCGEIARKGVVLARARTYLGETELFAVEFPPAPEDELPAFVNLQQTYTEQALLRRAEQTGLVDVRFNAPVTGLRQNASSVTLELSHGGEISASFAIAADGARSTVRELVGVPFPGKSFNDRFLIVDVRAELPEFPRDERRFYFDPPSNPGRQILVHPQPDGEWRIDWQVAPETDAEAERASGTLDGRIRALVGDAPYELVWLTAYRFHQRLASRFRVGRVFLAGDAAHLMAVFGARGMNSGVEDATNLAWKLALVRAGAAPDSLLDSYERERRAAARENLGVTGATMRFMAPPTALHRAWRNAILRGSLRLPRLRRFVNSGKLATPAVYPGQGPVGKPARAAEETRREVDHGFTLVGDCLVRPDGYVAAQLNDDSELETALRSALRGDLPA